MTATAVAASGMRSQNRIRVEGDSQLAEFDVQPPIVARHAGGRVLFGASAAGPLGGDDIDTEILVAAGAAARIGSVGASMVLPGRSGCLSQSRTVIELREDAHLDWRPEPTISVCNSEHRAEVLLRVGAGATAHIVEEYALGRTGERSGRLTTRVRIERLHDGWPLLHHEELLGVGQPGAGSLVSGAEHGHVVTSVEIRADGSAQEEESCTLLDPGVIAGRFVLDHNIVVMTIAAPDRPTALDALGRLSMA